MLLVLLLLSTGCKGKPLSKGVVDGGILGSGATADFLNRYIDAVCAHRVRCGQSLSNADCRTVLFDSGYFRIAELAMDIEKGRIVYDEKNATACFTDWETSACLLTSTWPKCDAIFRGTQPLHAPCVRDGECASGRCFISDCHAVGDACAVYGWCPENGCADLSCVPDCCLGACAPPQTFGIDSYMCGSDADCAPDASCEVWTIDFPTCRPRVGLGASCSNAGCLAGLYCSSSHTCRPPVKDGEPCSDGVPCENMLSQCDPASYTCRGRLNLGDPCTADASCPSYAVCSAGICSLLPAPGESCTVPEGESWTDGCRVGTCVNGLCHAETVPCTVESVLKRDAGVLGEIPD